MLLAFCRQPSDFSIQKAVGFFLSGYKITAFFPKKQKKHHILQKKCKIIWSCQKKAVPLHPLFPKATLREVP